MGIDYDGAELEREKEFCIEIVLMVLHYIVDLMYEIVHMIVYNMVLVVNV